MKISDRELREIASNKNDEGAPVCAELLQRRREVRRMRAALRMILAISTSTDYSEIQEASDGCTVIRESSNQNADLIVAMRNALPALLAVAEAAEKSADWPSTQDCDYSVIQRELESAVRALSAGGFDV